MYILSRFLVALISNEENNNFHSIRRQKYKISIYLLKHLLTDRKYETLLAYHIPVK